MVRGMKRQIESDEWGTVKIRMDSVQEKPPEHDEDLNEEASAVLGAEQWAWDDI